MKMKNRYETHIRNLFWNFFVICIYCNYCYSACWQPFHLRSLSQVGRSRWEAIFLNLLL